MPEVAVWDAPPIRRHQFGAGLVAQIVALVLKAATSQRSAVKVLEILGEHLSGLARIPCANSARLWLLRLGLYELSRPKEVAEDWVWIMDHTVQLGPWKCLVIVGVRLSAWRNKRAPLEHEDLTLFNLTPMEQSTGEAVATQLEETRRQTGIVPAAVLSDEGAELKSGMALSAERSQEWSKVPHVYDIKHKVATFLKKELHDNQKWKSFVLQTNRTKLQVTLTSLAFLVPPGLKNKARYMNLDTLVGWGNRVLAYLDNPRDIGEQKVDRTKLRAKLGWLRRYRRSLAQWAELLAIAQCAETYVRREGYHRAAAEELDAELKTVTRSAAGQRLRKRLQAFLAEQGQEIPRGQRLLGSSEVLESLLGKYKRIQGTHSAGGMTGSLLNIGTAVLTKTTETIQQALATVPVAAVGKWVREKLGPTIPAQQSLLLRQNKNCTNIEAT